MFFALRMWDERVAGWNVVRVIETKPLDPAAFNKCFQRFRRKCYCDHARVLELRHEIAHVVDFRPGGGVTLSLIGVHVFASSFAQNSVTCNEHNGGRVQWPQRDHAKPFRQFFFPRSFLPLQVSTVAQIHRAGIQDDEIQRRKSKKESP